MRILVYLGHPAHYHLFRRVIPHLQHDGHEVQILVSGKDVLEDLLRSDAVDYIKISEGSRKSTLFSRLGLLWRRGIKIYRILRQLKPDLMAGTSAEGPFFSHIAGIPFVNLNEDDHDVVPLYSKLSYPFSSCILMPEGCRAGRWQNKTVFYPGYHELAYLHPAVFTPDTNLADSISKNGKAYVILRFSALAAHHDLGKKGLTESIAEKIIHAAGKRYHLIISSERELPSKLDQYRMNFEARQMHDVMAGAALYIGDSQTMAAEAAMLGTPFIRYNDFVGRISYLDHLENDYGLGYGFKPGQEQKMLEKISEILDGDVDKNAWMKKRDLMLKDKIETAGFLHWFLKTYPESYQLFKNGKISWQDFKPHIQ